MMVRITIVVDNFARPPFVGEHGLSLFLEYGATRLLFDTGAGEALDENLKLLGISPGTIRTLVLSHGHNDHTGGASLLLERGEDGPFLYHAPGLTVRRFSRHPDRPVSEISLPEATRTALAAYPHRRETESFTEIERGVFLTGPIPRGSGEDTGGPFFLDADGAMPDSIADEQALLLDCGVLMTGCGHAGIMNTLNCCRAARPHIRIRTVIGGLHLNHADETRLHRTAYALREAGIERLIPLHCTGPGAIARLRELLPQLSVDPLTAGARIVL